MTPEEQKKIIKEALKEWLNDKFLEFGKWSFGAVAALSLTAILYLILTMQGWHK